MKNPLATAVLGIDYLNQVVPREDPQVAAALDELAMAIQRADEIVRGLVGFSASRQLDLCPRAINDVVEQALRLLRRNVRCNRELANDLPAALWDRVRMEQVLVNLITNSLQAMPEQGTLTIRTSQQRFREASRPAGHRTVRGLGPGDPAIVVEIEDTGKGIPPAHLARVFDPFYTAQPTGSGTGLGLAVAKKIFDLHHGQIEIHNREGGGIRVLIAFAVPSVSAVPPDSGQD